MSIADFIKTFFVTDARIMIAGGDPYIRGKKNLIICAMLFLLYSNSVFTQKSTEVSQQQMEKVFFSHF
ncbi:MAG: hypothetical protein ABI480_12915 [Chitinophagaceae bacterium]